MQLGLLFLSFLWTVQGAVIFSEIMYRGRISDDHQFVEFYNNGTSSVDMTDWTLLIPGTIFPFPNFTLAPASYVLVAPKPPQILERYPQLDSSKVLGPLPVYLPRDGSMQLTDPMGNLMAEAAWTNDEKVSNGYGPSLEIQCLTAPASGDNWKPSPLQTALDFNEEQSGSPLGPSSWSTCPPTPLPAYASPNSPIHIVTIMYRPYWPYAPTSRLYVDSDMLEYIQLYNSGAQPFDLSHFRLYSDSENNGVRFTIPYGVQLAAGASLFVVKNQTTFARYYSPGPAQVLGNYQGYLGNGGADLLLVDDNGLMLERVEYEDTAPWPVAPDALAGVDPNRVCLEHPFICENDLALSAYWSFDGTVMEEIGSIAAQPSDPAPTFTAGYSGLALSATAPNDGFLLYDRLEFGSIYAVDFWTLRPLATAASAYRILLRGFGDYHGAHVAIRGDELGLIINGGFQGSGLFTSSLDDTYWNHIVVTSQPGNTTFYVNDTQLGFVAQQVTSPVQLVANLYCVGSQQWGVIDELKIYSKTSGETPGYALRRVNWDSPEVEVQNWRTEWGSIRLTPSTDPIEPVVEVFTVVPEGATGSPYLFSGDSAVVSVTLTGSVTGVTLHYVEQDPVTEEGSEVSVAMAGAGKDWTITIGPFNMPAGTIIRYRFTTATRQSPQQLDPLPYHHAFVAPGIARGSDISTDVFLFIRASDWLDMWNLVNLGSIGPAFCGNRYDNPHWNYDPPARVVWKNFVSYASVKYQGSIYSRLNGDVIPSSFMNAYRGVTSTTVRALTFQAKFPRFQRPDWRSEIIFHKSTQGCSYYTAGEIQTAVLELGLPGSRPEYGRQWVNGGFLRYTMMLDVHGAETAGRWTDRVQLECPHLKADVPGNFFKSVGGGSDCFGATITWGDMRIPPTLCNGHTWPEVYAGTYSLQQNETYSHDPAEYMAPLMQLIIELNSFDLGASDFTPHKLWFEANFDLGMMFTHTAVNIFASTIDDTLHNWYIYQRPIDNKWFMTPWDADGTFGDNTFGQGSGSAPLCLGTYGCPGNWAGGANGWYHRLKNFVSIVYRVELGQRLLDLSRTYFNTTGGLFPNVIWPDIMARVSTAYVNSGACPISCSWTSSAALTNYIPIRANYVQANAGPEYGAVWKDWATLEAENLNGFICPDWPTLTPTFNTYRAPPGRPTILSGCQAPNSVTLSWSEPNPFSASVGSLTANLETSVDGTSWTTVPAPTNPITVSRGSATHFRVSFSSSLGLGAPTSVLVSSLPACPSPPGVSSPPPSAACTASPCSIANGQGIRNCTSGQCQLTACTTNYHPNTANTACVINQCTPWTLGSCTMTGGIGQRICLPIYEWDDCYALSCSSGFRPTTTGTCEAAGPCTVAVPCYSPFALAANASCSGISYGQCLPSLCQPTYILSGTVCRSPPCTNGLSEPCQVGGISGSRSCNNGIWSVCAGTGPNPPPAGSEGSLGLDQDTDTPPPASAPLLLSLTSLILLLVQ